MGSTETKKKIDESAFVIIRDKATENVQLVASPTNFQVGLTSSPADLTLNGKLSISEKSYDISEANKWSTPVDDHITLAKIKTSYTSTSYPSSGYVTVILPKNPRVGQLIIIKDFSGASGTYPIRVYSADSGTIDGSSYQSITSNYGFLQLTWHDKNWICTTGELQTINIGYYTTNDGSKNVNIRGDIIKIGDTGGSVQIADSATSGIVYVGTAANAQTINIGTGAAAKTVTLGSTNGTSSTLIQAGAGGITMTGETLLIQAGAGGITMTGETLAPTQPAFLAYRDATSQLVPNTGATTVQFNAERFDTGSDFNTGTYTFTAPRTGKYVFNVSLRIDDIDTAASYYYVSLVTSNATYQLGIIDPNFSADLDYYSFGASVVADMDINDTALVQIRQSGGTSNQSSIVDQDTATQFCSFFSGWLLG